MLFRLLFVNLIGNLLILLLDLLRLPLVPGRPRWVRLVLRAPLPPRPVRRPWLLGGGGGPSIEALSRRVEELARDPKLVGVVVRIESLDGGWARLRSIRAALGRIRAAGKRLVVHVSAPDVRAYYVASVGDSLLVDETGPLALTGLGASVTFLAEGLEKAGVEMEAEFRGAYKSAAETFTRSDMSPAHREALDAVLDGLDAEVVGAVAAARRLEPARAAELLRGGPYTAEEAERAGLVDAVRYEDEIPAWLEVKALGTIPGWRRRRLRPLRWRPVLHARRRVQVVSLHGMIVDGEGGDFPRRLLGAEAAGRALARAREDDRVAAVVLHIDSRGGSATASDRIWRDVVLLGKKKPVVACFEDAAASGGYYLACAAARIVAQPTTLTGSIGVLAMKPNLEGLLDRLGIRTVFLNRGDAAAMLHPARGLSDDERRRLAAEVDALYRQFVRKVAEGRKLEPDAAEAVAQGRVWLGADAKERGLVDELGDAEAAIDVARGLARRRPGEELVVEDVHPVPRRRGLLVRLLSDPAGALVEELAPLLRARVLLVPPVWLRWW
jgi:protease IV